MIKIIKNKRMEERRVKIRREVALAMLLIPLALMLSSLITADNTLLIIAANVTTSRPDEVSQYDEIMAIKNYTNKSIPMITLGGVKVLYGSFDNLTVYASITLDGEPIDPRNYCNITITHYNGTQLVYDFTSTNMTRIGSGWYFFNWSFPGTIPKGAYGVLVVADPLGRKTQATSGFKFGFQLNVSITADVANVLEQLDCDNVDDSPLCDYTDGLQNSVDWIQDLLNCSNGINNSDLCNYTKSIEANLSVLHSHLLSHNDTIWNKLHNMDQNISNLLTRLHTHNDTIWDKLVTIQTTIGTINTNTDDLEEMLDCDTSANDVCTKINNIRTLVDMINLTTKDTLMNLSYNISFMAGDISTNVSSIREYAKELIREFNCSSVNPSDVCYRLQLVQNYTNESGLLADLLREINYTVNYINEVRWGNFSYTEPVPTVLIVQGKITQLSTGQFLSIGSVQVNITDAYASTIMWSHEYEDVIEDGLFNLLLGGTYDLSLIPEHKYRRDISVCNGITFDTDLYTCETFTTYFIA